MARERLTLQETLSTNQPFGIASRIEFPRERAHNPRLMETFAANPMTWPVAILMDCKMLAGNRWQTVQWEASGIVEDTGALAEQVVERTEQFTRLLFPGYQIRLFRDEAEGYLYNIMSPQPKVFVLWRMQADVARPDRVTVSYHEGARWMDTDERVDGVALPSELVPWIRTFAEQHYKPEPKKQKRYASNKDKGRMGRLD